MVLQMEKCCVSPWTYYPIPLTLNLSNPLKEVFIDRPINFRQLPGPSLDPKGDGL